MYMIISTSQYLDGLFNTIKYQIEETYITN
jgi:hypothetical protein